MYLDGNGLEYLKQIKRLAGRLQDLAVLENLEN